jgi:hypothetical protein
MKTTRLFCSALFKGNIHETIDDIKQLKLSKMRYFIKLIILITVLLGSGRAFGQDSLITDIAKKNLTLFTKAEIGFSGQGWDKILEQVKTSDFVLIGEDHFTNEIPYFISALTSKIKFDNFFCEIDPYLANILQNSLRNFSEPEMNKYISEYSYAFSFFSLNPEFELFKQLVRSNTNIYGLDQIFLLSDRVICNDLRQRTRNIKAIKIYASIGDSSKIYYEAYLKDHNMPFYFLTENFQKQLTELSLLDLSKEEKEIMDAFRISVKIYKEQNHHLRIQLMKNQLMNEYLAWSEKKNLFKFGGFHLAKGESLMKIYDIGNLVNNIADSKYKSSLNILVLEKSGKLGVPLRGFPEQMVDENSNNLKPLKPIFKVVNGEQWHCFDLLPLREALENGKIAVEDKTLSRIIKGYDFLVIIPTVTAAGFVEIK